MVSRKSEPTTAYNHNRPRLVITLVVLLLVVVAIAMGYLAGAGTLDANSLADQALATTFPRAVQGALREQMLVMSLPFAEGTQAYWFLARAGGVVSYLLLWLATCWGIIMSSKIFKGAINPGIAYALHEFLPTLGVVFAALHALVLLGDSYVNFDVWQLLIPFSSSYERFWTGLGTLAFYLFAALIISFYLRKQLGQNNWRALHYTSYIAFLLALAHGLMAGTDSGTPVMRAVYLVTGGLSLFLVYFRLLSYAPRANRARQGSQ